MLASSRADLRRSLRALGLSLLVPLSPALARAEDTAARDKASALFQSAVVAADRGQLSDAARDFEAAYALSPTPVVLYNLGQTQSALGRPVEAVRSLRLYLGTETAPLPADRQREVRELIAKNEQLIGTVTLQVTPAPEELEVDAAAVSPSTETLVLAAGHHVIVARRAGYLPGSTTLEVVPQAQVTATLALQPVAREVPPPPAPPPPSAMVQSEAPAPRAERSPAVQAMVWGGLGLGAVALGIGTGFVLSAVQLNSESKVDGHCNAQGCDSVGQPLREAAIRNGNIATGLLIAGGALVGIGVTTYLLTDPRDEKPKVAARLTLAGHHGDALKLDLKVSF